MTCRDCEHYEACSFWMAMADITRMFSKGACGFFKDKSKIIELPCKSGTKIYSIFENGIEEKEPYFIAEGEITSFCIEKDGIWFYGRYECGLKYWHDLDDISKTVFLTREEAEKALAEMEKNND